MILWLWLGCVPLACEPSAATWDNFTAGFIAGRCSSCHGSAAVDRHGAPEGVHFDTEAEVLGQLDAIEDTVFERGSMPPAGGLTEVESDHLAEWLACPA